MDGFYRAGPDDTDAIYKIIPDENYKDRVFNIKRLRVPEIYVFINNEGTALVAYEPAYGAIPWLTGHAYTSRSGRGAPLKELFWATGIWIFQNTEYEVITGVVPASLRRYGLFLGAMGATRQFDHKGTVMYSYSDTQVPEFQEKLDALRARKKQKENLGDPKKAQG